MDLSLYRLLLSQIPEPPALQDVKQGHLLAEGWPLVLESINSFRKQVQSFTVTDGTASVTVLSDVPDLYERIARTELGTIIHLLGPKTVFNPQRKGYVVHVEDFATLKQYDEHMRRVQEAEARRLADLADLHQQEMALG